MYSPKYFVIVVLLALGLSGCNDKEKDVRSMSNRERAEAASRGSCNRILTPQEVERGVSCWVDKK